MYTRYTRYDMYTCICVYIYIYVICLSLSLSIHTCIYIYIYIHMDSERRVRAPCRRSTAPRAAVVTMITTGVG